MLWKGTISVKFWANRSKFGGSCAFPQNFYNRELGEIAVFYTMIISLLVKSEMESYVLYFQLPRTIFMCPSCLRVGVELLNAFQVNLLFL